MELLTNYTQKSSPYLPNFNANVRQYIRAKRHLTHVRAAAEKEVMLKLSHANNGNLKFDLPKDTAVVDKILGLKPNQSLFSQSNMAILLNLFGIKILNKNKELEGIQYGIKVFENLTIREIMLLGYRADLAARRGCKKMCAHCIHDAKPASKTELSSMPLKDFKKILDGFAIIMKRINKFLGNDNNTHFIGEDGKKLIQNDEATAAAFFYDSDAIDVGAEAGEEEFDYVDLIEIFYKIMGRPAIIDTAGSDPDNEILQRRMEKLAEYLSQPDNEKKVYQFNLSINPFNPLYLGSFNAGYIRKKEDEIDLENPTVKAGKDKYDKYIHHIANMVVTLGTCNNVNLILRYATYEEKNMDGMYLSDLELILNDVEKKCAEILKEKYPTDENMQKLKKERISKLITHSIRHEWALYSSGWNPGCKRAGRYINLLKSRNPEDKSLKEIDNITPIVSDINALSPEEYEDFLNNNNVLVDADGTIYYYDKWSETSVRKLGKKLVLSTNDKKTPDITHLDTRDIKL